jgi:hypothetical protein
MDSDAEHEKYLAELLAPSPEDKPAVPAQAITEYAASDARDDSQLCEMIGALPLEEATYAAGVRSLLDLLADPKLGPLAKHSALRKLGAARFHTVRFAPFHAEFVDRLRRLAGDEDSDIRAAVLDRLTLINDPEAQRLLRAGLQKLGRPLVSAAKAIQLLARDDHGSDLPIFRELAVKAVGKAREEALRALVNDTKSVTLFEKLAANKDESESIRQIALTNLKNTSVGRFAQAARKVVLDHDDDDRLRAAAVAAITHTSDAAKKVVTPGFVRAVEAIATSTKSRALKNTIGHFSRLLGDK